VKVFEIIFIIWAVVFALWLVKQFGDYNKRKDKR
jgi:flagellar biogenesis protein FliO